MQSREKRRPQHSCRESFFPYEGIIYRKKALIVRPFFLSKPSISIFAPGARSGESKVDVAGDYPIQVTTGSSYLSKKKGRTLSYLYLTRARVYGHTVYSIRPSMRVYNQATLSIR